MIFNLDEFKPVIAVPLIDVKNIPLDNPVVLVTVIVVEPTDEETEEVTVTVAPVTPIAGLRIVYIGRTEVSIVPPVSVVVKPVTADELTVTVPFGAIPTYPPDIQVKLTAEYAPLAPVPTAVKPGVEPIVKPVVVHVCKTLAMRIAVGETGAQFLQRIGAEGREHQQSADFQSALHLAENQ